MSGAQTIAPSGRESPCSAVCGHPVCAGLRKLARIDRVAKLVDSVNDALDGAPADVANDAWLALEELARMARGEA